MKIQYFLPLFFCLHLSQNLLCQNLETEVESTITAVTVFQVGAQVTREVEAAYGQGTSTFKFVGISSKIDPESIQLKTEGDFTVLSITHQLNYFEPPKVIQKIEELESLKDSLILEVELNKAEQTVLKQEEKMILANQSIGGTQTGVRIDDLKATAEFYQSRLTEISKKLLLVGRENRMLNERIQQVHQQVIEMNADEKSIATSEILVKIEADNNGTAKFELGYFVQEAAWEPSYDVKVEDVAGPTELVYKAIITQNTEEDWKNVQLTLSTGEPTLTGQQPQLAVWRLGYYSKPAIVYRNIKETTSEPGTITGIITDENGEPLIGASVLVKGTSTGTITDFDGRYSIPVPEGTTTLTISYTGYEAKEVSINNSNQINVVLNEGMMLDEVVVTGLAGKASGVIIEKEKRRQSPSRPEPVNISQNSNTTTHEFALATPFSIPADNKNYTVNIGQYQIPAEYQYVAVPKLENDAFLEALLSDWEQYHLLSGEASLFFENTFVGKSFIDVENISDTLSISLGRDENVVILRNKQEQFSAKNFVGNKKVETIAWTIEVRNKKSHPISLTIQDQIPVSIINEIDVKLLEEGGAEYDEERGFLSWKLALAPSQAIELNFKYQVKHPGKRRVVLE